MIMTAGARPGIDVFAAAKIWVKLPVGGNHVGCIRQTLYWQCDKYVSYLSEY
jgi:hypothetical protein